MKSKISIRIVKISALCLSIIVVFGLISPNFLEKSNVRALGDLTVNWNVSEGNPIFVVNNWAPGQSETKSVIVTNGGSGIRPVGTKIKNVDDPSNLSSMIDFKISDGATDLYGGASPTGPKTLSNAFTDSIGLNGIFLSNINAGVTKTYVFTAKFKDSADNTFQNTHVIFDITMGISIDLPDECEQIEFFGDPIFGTSKGDSLKGTAGNDLIVGFEGGDSIDGKDGDDCILGGDGGDSIKGGTGNDIISAGTGGDTLKGEDGNDLLLGEDGGDSIEGGKGEDLIFGAEGSDSLKGGDSNDKLYGANGDDSLSGDDGNDELYGENGKDSLKGGSGNDTLIGGASTFDSANGNAGTDTCDAESETACELNP